MITEDYVSFEVAKLLKERGFRTVTNAYYDCDGNINITPNAYIPKGYDTLTSFILCPTLQMAMKWLREVHHLHITIFSSSQESWMYRITKPHQTLEEGYYGEDYISFEEACEAAIKYCLENLI